jgi:hypothetical protein
VVAGLALTVAAPLASAAKRPQPAKIVMGFTNDWPEERGRIGEMKEMGARTGRQFICWCDLEPSPDNYDWRLLDMFMPEMKAHGIKPVLVVYGTPAWARGNAGNSLRPPLPEYDDRWANIFTQIARRYGHDLRAVEVWNEPNLNEWYDPVEQGGSGANPGRYAQLLQAAYRGTKAGNGGLTVVMGAPTGDLPTAGGNYNDALFLEQVCRSGGASAADAIATHPYPEPTGPWIGQVRVTLERLMAARNRACGGGKKLWITETGIASGGESTTHAIGNQKTQAEGLSRILKAVNAMRKQVPVLIFFRYSDIQYRFRDHVPSWNAHAGVVESNGAKKRAWGAIQKAMRDARQTVPKLKIKANPPKQAQTRQEITFTAVGWNTKKFGTPHYQWNLQGNPMYEVDTGQKNSVKKIYYPTNIGNGVLNIGVQVTNRWDQYRASIKYRITVAK